MNDSLKKTVSIVIPAYNEQETIRACVQAAIDQTVPADEIIVVDNRSTDNTARILRDIQEEHPQVPLIVLRQDDLQGITPTRNVGFDAATSDIIGRIDCDTILEPNWVEEVHKAFRDPSVDAATGPVIYYDMPLRRYIAKADNTLRKAIFKLATSYKFLFGTNMALRREAWWAVRDETCMDEENLMHEDLDLSVHLYDAGFKAIYAPDMLVGMSARRMDSAPKDFLEYVARIDRTYTHHGIRKKRLRVPGWVYLAIYPLAKGIRWGQKFRAS